MTAMGLTATWTICFSPPCKHIDFIQVAVQHHTEDVEWSLTNYFVTIKNPIATSLIMTNSELDVEDILPDMSSTMQSAMTVSQESTCLELL